jgi:hypothetical protein
MMGMAFLTLFLSNITIGRLGGLYEHMTRSAFWALNAAIAAASATLAFVLARPFTRVLARE